MDILNEVYSRFDAIVEDAGLWKVETVGDAYIVVGGLAVLSSTAPPLRAVSASELYSSVAHSKHSSDEMTARINLDKIFHVAARMLDELTLLRKRFSLPLHMRIAVHYGDVVTGTIGSQRPRFCVLGQAVTEAEHVEATAQVDCITCTYEARHRYIASAFRFSEVHTELSPGHTASRSDRYPENRFHVSLHCE